MLQINNLLIPGWSSAHPIRICSRLSALLECSLIKPGPYIQGQNRPMKQLARSVGPTMETEAIGHAKASCSLVPDTNGTSSPVSPPNAH